MREQPADVPTDPPPLCTVADISINLTNSLITKKAKDVIVCCCGCCNTIHKAANTSAARTRVRCRSMSLVPKNVMAKRQSSCLLDCCGLFDFCLLSLCSSYPCYHTGSSRCRHVHTGSSAATYSPPGAGAYWGYSSLHSSTSRCLGTKHDMNAKMHTPVVINNCMHPRRVGRSRWPRAHPHPLRLLQSCRLFCWCLPARWSSTPATGGRTR